MISKIVYESAAWRGFATQAQVDRLEAIIKRAKRGCLCPHSGPSISDIMDDSDTALFSKVLVNDKHVLHGLLPPVKDTTYNLRPRAHDRILPVKNSLSIKNFLHRLLYRDIY